MLSFKQLPHPMPLFSSNYPCQRPGEIALLSTPERTGAISQYTGKGVTIAFIDSGFYRHPDLKGRIRTHVDATTDEIIESDVIPKSQAYSWHGQMTSVIACGDGGRSGGRYRGIASDAQVVLIKVSNPRNEIKERDIERGLRWLLDNHHRYQIKLVNLSVGGDYVSYDPYHFLHRLIRYLVADGVTVIAAAGNRPVNHLFPPASSADAITVGGLDDNNTIDRAEWILYNHNYGMAYDGSNKPDLIAPARWIASPILPSTQVAFEAFWLGALLDRKDPYQRRELIMSGKASKVLERLFGGHRSKERLYETMQQRIYAHKLIDPYHQHVDGTSVAAPIVAAVAAQMLEVNARLKPQEIRQILRETAQPLTQIPREQQGAGVINAVRAVQRAIEWK
jgi:serine protease AprX